MFESSDAYFISATTIFEGAVSMGKDRLVLVLSWLENITDHYEFFESYLRELDTFNESLDEEQKLIILTTSSFLGVNATEHGWGKSRNGVVSEWLASLKDDV